MHIGFAFFLLLLLLGPWAIWRAFCSLLFMALIAGGIIWAGYWCWEVQQPKASYAHEFVPKEAAPTIDFHDDEDVPAPTPTPPQYTPAQQRALDMIARWNAEHPPRAKLVKLPSQVASNH